ncbi:hypothetical protein Cgig2_008501 [Carnegiea gigantea]|uniref:Transposase-associated domain-containing protein n=1 Tax=Carnegiea gigantea TaxID=171969 RepID=A0A9Q1QGC1_9CARY|nr:hypothetical protein Cgig2_008501 [Carnegiea gigantea]
MDSSWIELPNDHPDYLNGAVKFIKLAKENFIEERTQCPCRRCKVNKWLPIEVEQHILFKGFYKEYKHFIFHGKGDVLDHVKHRGSTSRETNNDPPNFVGQDDMEALLKAAFVIPGSRDDIVHDVENIDRTLKALGTKSSEIAQPLTHPNSSIAIAKLAIQYDLKPPTQPTSSLRALDSLMQQPSTHPSSKPLVQKPLNLVPTTQVQQPHRPITSPASEQTSKRSFLKNAELTTASILTIEQPHVRCPTSSGAPRPPIQPLRPPTSSTRALNGESLQASQ